jgi:signal transduction histidine kinase
MFFHTVDAQEADRYARELRLLPALDAQANQAVLEARSNLKADYDTLEETLSELRRVHERVARPPSYLDADARLAIERRVEASRELLVQKEKLVEEFKTHNSVLRNSTAFAPIEATRLIALFDGKGAHVAAEDVEALVADLLVYHLLADGSARDRIGAREARLRSDATELQVETDVRALLRHADAILEHEPKAQQATTALLGVASGAAAEDLDGAYARRYAELLKSQSRARLLGFASAFLAISLFGADVIRRQRAAAQVLRSTASQLENALESLRIETAREREIVDMKRQFVSLASHEFRTPLATILSSSELVEAYGSQWDEGRKAPYYRRIADAVKDMTEMLDSILLVSRAEAGKVELQKEALDVGGFCAELVASLQDGPKRSHRIEYSFGGDWSGARLDPRHLRHVLLNLLSNAMKYSPGRDSVRFDVRTQGEEGVFTVEDSGIGIPEADLDRLYQSFQRGSNVSGIPGTGLGLAIAKHSVDACRGRLTVSSEVGEGTRFVVYLPLDRGDTPNLARAGSGG